MSHVKRLIVLLAVIATATATHADSGQSTRVTDALQLARGGDGKYPYRSKSEYVLKELDIRAGDVVVDIGAGDGWWAAQMAERIGANGAVHAAEVDQKLVDRMMEKFTDNPRIRPYLCPKDGTGLEEDSCDLAFLSKTYHHLPNQVDYLRHLHDVLKPTGRICVIEQHAALGRGRSHALSPGSLVQQAEEAGWILVRYEMIAGTHHFLAIFVQRGLFVVRAQPDDGTDRAGGDLRREGR